MTETAPEYETADPFAVGIASAQAALDEATAAHQTAQEKEQRIKARLKALADERAAIQKARERDESDEATDEKHAARLALITADCERLNELLIPASEAARLAAQAVAVASERVKQAHAEHARHVAQQDAQALERRLRELETLFCRGLAELGRLKREAGGGRDILHGAQIFQPAAALTRFIVGGQVPQL